MMNSNSTHEFTNLTSTGENDSSNYDYTGATIYIVIVLLWYSIGIIFMLGMQMRARSETVEESARRRTKILIRSLRNHSNTKEILEELVDKQKRARLWDIYLGATSPPKEKLHRAETVRIRNIEKQLASMNRHHNRRLTNESIFPIEDDIRTNRKQIECRQISLDESSQKRPSTLRRRSSFDEQTLERLKAAQQDPMQTNKFMIRSYFRRNIKNPLTAIRQESTSPSPSSQIDNFSLFTDHITNLTRHRSNTEFDETIYDCEQGNPYLTYFYRSSDRPNILTTEFFPVTSQQSIS